jgi:hypothetical protein
MIKTRIQTQWTLPLLTMRETAAAIKHEYGWMGFYRGLWPTLIRAVPANALCFLGLETTLRVFGAQRF